jgi:hypothetical protein
VRTCPEPDRRYRLSVRRLYILVSNLLVVPAFRLGLGRLLGNPITGYYMVLRTTGRRTGRTRRVPVTYAIEGENVYCLAGYGERAAWYLNALAARDIVLLMPGRRVEGRVEQVVEPAERLIAARRIFRNAGLMGLTEGFNPYRDDDETVREKTAEMPVLRVGVPGLASGAWDPGGRAWLWMPATLLAVVLAIAAGAGRRG